MSNAQLFGLNGIRGKMFLAPATSASGRRGLGINLMLLEQSEVLPVDLYSLTEQPKLPLLVKGTLSCTTATECRSAYTTGDKVCNDIITGVLMAAAVVLIAVDGAVIAVKLGVVVPLAAVKYSKC